MCESYRSQLLRQYPSYYCHQDPLSRHPTTHRSLGLKQHCCNVLRKQWRLETKCVELPTAVETLQMGRVRGSLQMLRHRQLSAQDVRSWAPAHLLTYCMLQWCLRLFQFKYWLMIFFQLFYFSVFFFPWNIMSTLHDYQLIIMYTVLFICFIRITFSVYYLCLQKQVLMYIW